MTMSLERSVWAGVLSGVLLWSTACANEDEAFDVEGQSSALRSSSGTVVDVVAADPNYSTLVAAVQAAGLVDALANPEAQYTVFAPTNAAFERALSELGLSAQELLSEDKRDVLTSILLYHVAQGAAASADVLRLDGGSVTSLQGDDIDINIVRRRFIQLNEDGYVIDADNRAKNGIVHGVNRVLLPPSLFGSKASLLAKLETRSEYSTLVAAVKFAGLESALSDPKADLTLLAPTNRAFERALSQLGLSAEQLLADGKQDLVKQILLYHVIKGEVRSEAVRAAAGGDVPTLEGETIHVSVSPFGVIELNQGIYVRRADIDTTNGVIHSLSGVLLPPSLKL
jgi:transforming growth factor-beta-induced protein